MRFTLCLMILPFLVAQQMPPSPVGYTEARRHEIRDELTLPGTVETNVVSLVASEIAGLVVEYPVKVGDRVAPGQMLARLNTRDRELDLAAIEARLKEAEARQKLAQRNYERSRDLFDAKVFSQQQLDDTFYEADAWQGNIDNLNAEIDRIRYDIDRSVISAPFAGAVVSKHTELGQWLGVGDEVVELLSLDELEVRVDVPERYFPSTRIGASATVTFEAIPGKSFPASVVAVIPRADEQARTFPLKLRLAVSSAKIGVGMLAEVRLVGLASGKRSTRTATIVPKDAVVRQGNQLLVWILDDQQGVANPVPVKTGNGVGSWIEVMGPAAPGAKVITRGNERLRPGQPVLGEPINYELP